MLYLAPLAWWSEHCTAPLQKNLASKTTCPTCRHLIQLQDSKLPLGGHFDGLIFLVISPISILLSDYKIFAISASIRYSGNIVRISSILAYMRSKTCGLAQSGLCCPTHFQSLASWEWKGNHLPGGAYLQVSEIHFWLLVIGTGRFHLGPQSSWYNRSLAPSAKLGGKSTENPPCFLTVRSSENSRSRRLRNEKLLYSWLWFITRQNSCVRKWIDASDRATKVLCFRPCVMI